MKNSEKITKTVAKAGVTFAASAAKILWKVTKGMVKGEKK
jgi:hypothetical protein